MTDTTNHAEVIRDLIKCFRVWDQSVRILGNVRAGDAADALDALTRELEELTEASLCACGDQFNPDFPGVCPSCLIASEMEHEELQRQVAAFEQRHEEDAAEVKRLNHALTDCNAEVLEQAERIQDMEATARHQERLRLAMLKDSDAQSKRITTLEAAVNGMLAMYASGPNDDDWVHPAVKFARAALAPLAPKEKP